MRPHATCARTARRMRHCARMLTVGARSRRSQLMRYHIVSFLEELRKTSSAGGKPLSDADIVTWANDAVAGSGSARRIRDFGDKSVANGLANGLFLIDLLAAVEPRCVDRAQ
eukprot:2395936-Prymnesium_polylepis.1